MGGRRPAHPHAIAAANAGANRDIPAPSGRLLNQAASLLYTRADHRGAEPLMRRHLEIFLQFTRDIGHQHPHLNHALNNYRILLVAMGDSQGVAVEKLRALAKPYSVSW